MSGEIACACDGGTRLLKLSGEVRHDNAAALEELIEGWFDGEGEAIGEVIIDLNALRFMDSTVIGLLAAIAREMVAAQRPKPVVFSTNAEINSLLRSLRLDEALTLVERCEQRLDRSIIGLLGGGKARAINAIIDVAIDTRVPFVDVRESNR